MVSRKRIRRKKGISTIIPIAIPVLDGNELSYLNECIRTNFVSSVGPFVDRFEAEVAKASGTSGAVAVSSGTAGLHLALLCVGVSPGDLVLLPTYTFIASANAIAHCGATPWLIDIAADSWTLDPKRLQSELVANTKIIGDQRIHIRSGRRVAAVMPVYTLGLPSDMDLIVTTANEFGLPVVADAAAALGATYKGRLSGALGADISVYSFNGNKTVTAGGGGALTSDDETLLERAKHISTTARVGNNYHHDLVGYNYRLTNLQAAVGVAQMERLNARVTAKRQISDSYATAFLNLNGVLPFASVDWAIGSCWLSGIYLPTADIITIEAIFDASVAAGINARPFWKPVHLQPPFAKAPGEMFPVADDIWQRIFPLPCSTNLKSTEQEKVIKTMTSILETHLA